MEEEAAKETAEVATEAALGVQTVVEVLSAAEVRVVAASMAVEMEAGVQLAMVASAAVAEAMEVPTVVPSGERRAEPAHPIR